MTTPQAPIGSGFSPATTADEALAGADLTGKVAIVTGGYAGIGVEATRVLAAAGATVIVPARDRAKAIEGTAGIPRVELAALDLMDPASIDAFATAFLASGRPLHLLINNAGIMNPPLMRDARGYESQFSTNHLGHFQLAVRLWPALRRAKGARIVAVSSRGHIRSGIDFDDPNFQHRDYEKRIAYGQSKTANALFAVDADRRGAGDGIRAFSLHPGGILTDLTRFMSEDEVRATGALGPDGRQIVDPARNWKTPAQGAATTVWCAVSPQLAGMGGVYCENSDIALAVDGDSTALLGVRPWAMDAVAAERLWDLSERLTGVSLE